MNLILKIIPYMKKESLRMEENQSFQIQVMEVQLYLMITLIKTH